MKNLIRRWRATWQPDMYHGWGRAQNYFEGWYFKIVDATEGVALAFIPGISMAPDGSQHAFIQVLDGKNLKVEYHRFAAENFQPSDQKFHLNLANNQFSTNNLTLDLPDIKGSLRLENTTPWPKMLGAPGIMGWFSFVPFMECYHGIVSLDHTLHGSLTVNGRTVDFTGGRGYIEKDWGVSFPRAWFWMQSNHFHEKNGQNTEGGILNSEHRLTNADSLSISPTSLIASVAHIPWLGNFFVGYIVGFWWQGKLYRFATYTGAKMKAQLVDNQIFLSFKDGKNQLDITATKAGTGSLISPIQGEMTGKVSESLQANLHVKFYENDQLIFEGTGRNAGLEAAGAVDVLLTDKWRR
jgi:tocopherol cyclase